MEDKDSLGGVAERRGAKNLIILGVASVAIAAITTSVSLIVYHYSGDIYLDRSRPGYLPDEAEAGEDDEGEKYRFEKNGEVNVEDLKEYLENLERELKTIDTYDKSYDSNGLSDERLGIPVE